MSGLNASLFVGLSGLQAQQGALEVVGHNIANVNTPGYTRQRADLTANPSQNFGNVNYGTGVSLSAIEGLRDRYLDLQVIQENSKQTGAQDRFAGLESVATNLSDDTASGLRSQFQTFLNAFQQLAARPEDSAVRTNVLSTANALAAGLKTRYTFINDQRDSADKAVGSLVSEVNSLTSQIATLNQRIASETVPGSENDARDQRKVATEKLAQLVGIQVYEGNKGDYTITLDSGQAALVSGSTAFSLSATVDPTLQNHLRVDVNLGGGNTINVTSGITNGTLGAKLDLRDRILPGYQQRLDEMAAGLATSVNALHSTGFGLDGVSGRNFFTPNAAFTTPPNYQGAVNALQVDPLIQADANRIAASSVASAQGDNGIARAIANLQNSINAVDTNGDGLGDAGFTGAVGSLVNLVGTQSQGFQSQADLQQNILTGLQNQRDRISAVDLDEEAAQMIQLQRGYQASARFLSVIDQLTDQLVNQFGK